MAKVLIIGAGGVGQVVAHKCAQVPEVFSEIVLASRNEAKCATSRPDRAPDPTAQVDADNVAEMVALIRREKPELVINVALPYQDLPIMDACLETGVRLPRHRQLRAAGRGEVRVQLAVGLPGALQTRAGIMAPAGLRLRSGRDQRVHRLRAEAPVRRDRRRSTSSTATPATTARPSRPTSTRRSTSARSRPRGSYWENGQWVETDPLSDQQHVRLPRRHRPEEDLPALPRGAGIARRSTSRGCSAPASG